MFNNCMSFILSIKLIYYLYFFRTQHFKKIDLFKKKKMSQKPNRPPHDRSRHINDYENNSIIQLVEKENGVVSYAFKHFNFYLKL